MHAFLGDLVGYGADPVACLGLLADYAAKGALLVRGNHDEAALGGNNAAAYALYDEEQRMLTFFRVPYDHMTAARKIVEAGLPERLAWRLQKGE